MSKQLAAATKSAGSLLARYRQLSPSAAVFVSPLCLGTMNFGTSMKAMLGECSKETTFEILDYYFDQGGNFIDTANSYQGGGTETWLGEWMAARKNRDQIVLATKYTGPHRLQDPSIQIRANYGGNGIKSLRLTLEDSLKRLQTDYVDVLYVHWWNYTATIPEVMHSLNDLVVSGKVLYLGISDSPAWLVAKANQYARDHGLRPFVVYQGPWNAAFRDLEREVVPMCRDEGMGICAYSALNSGKFQTAAAFEERKSNNPGRNLTAVSTRDKQVSQVLEKMADAKETTLTNVALSYILDKEPYVFPIVGGRKLSHIKGNIEGLSVTLTEEEIVEIDNAYSFDPGFPHNFLSGTLMQGWDAPQKLASRASEVRWTQSQGTFDWVESPKAIRPGPATSGV
ncbi:alcohol dehydrogenase [Capronia epimyces CBS 606.96]|uniref:Alcohol dehydrogenase n=1 Tax=Capronia epimyces CBS 606.96 TaxID=1182542 RepID=W9YSH5_9EURO|nr:alcohol dehydrogenase [Capronia epimyces CBS 606.96]EXJ85239.1 alcohol dehydrogenase [Capronia epimyces CBS 606.96]